MLSPIQRRVPAPAPLRSKVKSRNLAATSIVRTSSLPICLYTKHSNLQTPGTISSLQESDMAPALSIILRADAGSCGSIALPVMSLSSLFGTAGGISSYSGAWTKSLRNNSESEERTDRSSGGEGVNV
uniref:Uncharacterized protein n=1 Tax=Knipowitschia caucasica TaxID=637954 RepID=A0AAV2M8B1_KNICA